MQKLQIMAIFTDHPDYKTLSDLLQLSHTQIVTTCKPQYENHNKKSLAEFN